MKESKQTKDSQEELPSLPVCEVDDTEYTLGGLLQSYMDAFPETAPHRSYMTAFLSSYSDAGHKVSVSGRQRSDFKASLNTLSMVNFMGVIQQTIDFTKLKQGYVHLITGINGKDYIPIFQYS
ncbi:MAG: hypothetical protein EOP45_22560 [Sphingobacteriaceae bacterium]|nr:MAG: hypothetical protein EOP45_22560 [Sphingobacteriaceae bacterium]